MLHCSCTERDAHSLNLGLVMEGGGGGWGNTSALVYSASVRFLNGIRPLFYVEPPSKSSFETIEEVPDYLNKVAWTVDSVSPTARLVPAVG